MYEAIPQMIATHQGLGGAFTDAADRTQFSFERVGMPESGSTMPEVAPHE